MLQFTYRLGALRCHLGSTVLLSIMKLHLSLKYLEKNPLSGDAVLLNSSLSELRLYFWTYLEAIKPEVLWNNILISY